MTHTNTQLVPAYVVCVSTSKEWDPIPPKQIPIVRVRNFWQRHFVAAYMHISANSHPTQPALHKPSKPIPPLLHLFLCSVSSRCFWAGQWHRPLLPFACILPQLWQKLSWLTDALKKDKQLEHLASETSCLQDLPTQQEIESHLKIELSICNKELQGCTSYQHRLKSKMQDEKKQNIFSFLLLIHPMHILTCTVTFIVFPL